MHPAKAIAYCRGDEPAAAAGHLVATFSEVMRHGDLVAWDDDRLGDAFVAEVAAVAGVGADNR